MTSAESRLAAASNEIRVRVESSKNRLTTVRPRRAGSFLIGRSARRPHLLGGVQDQLGVGAGQVAGAQQVPVHRCSSSVVVPEMVTASSPSNSLEPDLDRLDQRGRQVLAHEVGADRQLAVAAVDQHGEPDGAGPADVVDRVEGGPDGAPGEQHVVDEHDDLAVDAAVRDLGRQQGAGRAHPQVVAVHRHVERADGHVAGPRPRRSARRCGGPAGRRGWGCPAGPGRRRPCCARGSRARCGSAPGRCRGGPARCGRRRAAGVAQARGGRTSFSASRDGSLKDVDRGPTYQPAGAPLGARACRPAHRTVGA